MKHADPAQMAIFFTVFIPTVAAVTLVANWRHPRIREGVRHWARWVPRLIALTWAIRLTCF